MDRSNVINKLMIATNSVTTSFLNSHCIVCGSEFQKKRASKLYCSPRCKQYGFNHKKEVFRILETRKANLSEETLVFSIDDYIKFERKQKSLRRHQELTRKKNQWELVDQEIRLKDKYGLTVSDMVLSLYVSKKLTLCEEDELFTIECEMEEFELQLNHRSMSLEQWSFIKYLFPTEDESSLFEIISSLSKEFIDQLTLSEIDSSKNEEKLIIKNNFANHCNLIASGVIRFEKKDAAVL